MKILRVGDPHIKVSNLDESDRLMQFVLDQANSLSVDTVEFLGDMADTHAIVRLEVLEFLDRWFRTFASQGFKTIVLVGNHDLTGSYSSKYSALTPFRNILGNLKIIETPTLIGKIGYLPYIHDNEVFVSEANNLAALGAKVLVSHTTYEGSAYDNGMYAPNGVNHEHIDLSVTNLVSGHIHSTQEFGRVQYPGTARWATASDANAEKGIYLYTHDEEGAIAARDFIDTKSVCTPIIGIERKESDTSPLSIPEGAEVYLSLIGTSAWIQSVKEELRGKKGLKISSKFTDTKRAATTRKSGKSLMEFVTSHYETKKRDKLISFMQELKIV